MTPEQENLMKDMLGNIQGLCTCVIASHNDLIKYRERDWKSFSDSLLRLMEHWLSTFEKRAVGAMEEIEKNFPSQLLDDKLSKNICEFSVLIRKVTEIEAILASKLADPQRVIKLKVEVENPIILNAGNDTYEQSLQNLLSAVADNTRTAIEFYYGLWGKTCLTERQISSKLGKSIAHTQRIINLGMNRIGRYCLNVDLNILPSSEFKKRLIEIRNKYKEVNDA